MSKSYEIQTVTVISQGEQIAYVQTPAGGFIVGTIPEAFTDAREAGIIARASSLDEAQRKFSAQYNR